MVRWKEYNNNDLVALIPIFIFFLIELLGMLLDEGGDMFMVLILGVVLGLGLISYERRKKDLN